MSTVSISLDKGQKIDITKNNPSLKKVSVGLGWDVSNSSSAFDLDASAYLLQGGKLYQGEKGVIYFRHLEANGVKHSGDNLTGQGDGDDEVISLDFDVVPAEVEEVVVYVNIYQATERHQNFGQVKNAFVRLFETETGNELAKFDLSEDFSAATAVEFAKVYRHNGEWKFNAIGNPSNGTIADIAAKY